MRLTTKGRFAVTAMIDLALRQVLHRPHEVVSSVYFPETSVATRKITGRNALPPKMSLTASL